MHRVVGTCECGHTLYSGYTHCVMCGKAVEKEQECNKALRLPKMESLVDMRVLMHAFSPVPKK